MKMPAWWSDDLARLFVDFSSRKFNFEYVAIKIEECTMSTLYEKLEKGNHTCWAMERDRNYLFCVHPKHRGRTGWRDLCWQVAEVSTAGRGRAALDKRLVKVLEFFEEFLGGKATEYCGDLENAASYVHLLEEIKHDQSCVQRKPVGNLQR